MADDQKKSVSGNRITERERYRFIGFDVFPGEPKDLFKNETERDTYLQAVKDRRQSKNTVRDECTLLVERVSKGERIILAVASIVMLAAFFLPWYSVYREFVKEADPPVVQQAADSLTADQLAGDSLPLSDAAGDTLPNVELTAANPESVPASIDGEDREQSRSRVQSHQGESANEEILTGHVRRDNKVKVYTHLSGLGAFASLGTIGGKLFSSGIVLVVSTLLMLLYGLVCIALPFVNFYGAYGLKGPPDAVALKLKSYLRLNWLPLILIGLVILLSFPGAEYGFDTTQAFTSVGSAYGPGILLGTLSWGILVTVAASVLVAVKGIEI